MTTKPAVARAVVREADGLEEELGRIHGYLEIQSARIESALQIERTLGMPIRQVDDMLRVGGELVERSLEIKERLGLAKPATLRVSHEQEVMARVEGRITDPVVLAVMKDPVKRSRVLGVLHRILERAANVREPDEFDGQQIDVAPTPMAPGNGRHPVAATVTEVEAP